MATGIGIKVPPTLCAAKMNIYDRRQDCYDSTNRCYDGKFSVGNTMVGIAVYMQYSDEQMASSSLLYVWIGGY
jgi:hypothetical protein